VAWDYWRSQFCGQTGDRQTADAETQTLTDTLSDNKGAYSNTRQATLRKVKFS